MRRIINLVQRSMARVTQERETGKKEKRKGRDRERKERVEHGSHRKFRSGRNWGGGWRATGPHAAPRRSASLNIWLYSSSLWFCPNPLTVSFHPTSRNNSPPRRQTTLPASNSNLRSPLVLERPIERCYELYGVFWEKIGGR